MRRMTRNVCVCVGAVLVTVVPVRAQTPDTDVYIAELTMRGGRPVIGPAVNVTRRAGYDNQPHFALDGRSILYTAIDSTGQADIWRFHLGNPVGSGQRLTRTAPESEYSATPLRGGGFSVIRVERDSVQRLWRFDDDGNNPSVVVEQVRPVGYHAWLDDDVVVMFVLGSPATLQRARVRTGEVTTHASDIGRSLQKVPGRASVSFVQRTVVAGVPRWEIRELNAAGSVSVIAPVPERPAQGEARAMIADFHAWTPSGVLLTSLGSTILAWDATARAWQRVADLSALNLTVTRMAVSPNGDRIAFVGQPAAPR